MDYLHWRLLPPDKVFMPKLWLVYGCNSHLTRRVSRNHNQLMAVTLIWQGVSAKLLLVYGCNFHLARRLPPNHDQLMDVTPSWHRICSKLMISLRTWLLPDNRVGQSHICTFAHRTFLLSENVRLHIFLLFKNVRMCDRTFLALFKKVRMCDHTFCCSLKMC